MIDNRKFKKIFIKESIGSRNYFSYRSDLILYKVLLSILIFLTILLISDDISLSLLISGEVFLIFTLINKLNMDRKRNEGENQLILKRKKEHFKKKLEEININDFELLIGFLFEKKGCKNFVKKGRHTYLAEKEGLINCIKIYRLYENIELERIDVRNLVTYMCQNNIRIGYLITTGSLSEGAKELLEDFKDRLNITVIDFDCLFTMMEDYEILPVNDYFYNKIYEEEREKTKDIDIKKNVFENKKIVIYIFSAVFFYVASMIMPENNISRYISYYFIVLTTINIAYLVWIKYIALKN
ncbi:restriction endonuclease [Sedimentibacter sp.]|uniref:restriction endonuclease n=1 Tax=Sedimentibacter sp. TaxID=1960295 RepID=UPI0028ABC18D|nr:restriction endonuclease [Sedimentibacter sp.]